MIDCGKRDLGMMTPRANVLLSAMLSLPKFSVGFTPSVRTTHCPVLSLARLHAPSMRAADRRQILKTAAGASTIPTLTTLIQPVFAAYADQAPVLVLGAGGGTGYECIKYLIQKGKPCVAATKAGLNVLSRVRRDIPPGGKKERWEDGTDVEPTFRPTYSTDE